jgi:hypothetical protein
MDPLEQHHHSRHVPIFAGPLDRTFLSLGPNQAGMIATAHLTEINNNCCEGIGCFTMIQQIQVK